MGGSLKLATIQGIPVLLHWTFGLLFVWLGYVGFAEGMNAIGILWFFAFALLLFACVVVHEFGHALTARKFGVDTKDIILSPLGGLARLTRLPEKPIHEFLIALAGPATNVGIAILLFPIIWFSSSMTFQITDTADVLFTKPANLMPLLFYTNITLVVFNMIPAFPMDGGRVLRSLLAMSMNRLLATRIAVVIGQVFGLMFLLLALYLGELILGLIGVFVFFMATAEWRSAKMDHALRSKSASEVMRTTFTRVRENQQLGELAAVFMTGIEVSFLVFEENGYVYSGVLNASDLAHAYQQGESQRLVGELVKKEIVYTFPEASLNDSFYKMIQHKVDLIPVISGQQIVGVIDSRIINQTLQGNSRN
nr:site-2 protease family protein [Saprospiraceae bacterium]